MAYCINDDQWAYELKSPPIEYSFKSKTARFLLGRAMIESYFVSPEDLSSFLETRFLENFSNVMLVFHEPRIINGKQLDYYAFSVSLDGYSHINAGYYYCTDIGVRCIETISYANDFSENRADIFNLLNGLYSIENFSDSLNSQNQSPPP